MRVISLDPSGNFSKNEGSGTTGWALFHDGQLVNFGDRKAEDFLSLEDYWQDIWRLIMDCADRVVCESYRLQPSKAMQQSWSELETPQLIGYLRMKCWEYDIPITFNAPKDKVRVADPILEHKGIIEKKGNKYYCMGRPTNLHMRDAIRHGVYYLKYGKE